MVGILFAFYLTTVVKRFSVWDGFHQFCSIMSSRRSPSRSGGDRNFHGNSWEGLAKEYDPIAIGSIDGTDTLPHDNGIVRALKSEYKTCRKVKSDPHHTIFVGKLHPKTKQNVIIEKFKKFGTIVSCHLVHDIVTGLSKGYAFVEYSSSKAARQAYNYMNMEYIENSRILVDFEAGRRLDGWKPRRLGGGFGGKRESGQLRFGCRARPFQKPIVVETNRLMKKK